MHCALCQIKEADKKNTHFLTDSIIRSCLNFDGSNEREKGFYYDISTDKIFTDFNFQRVGEEVLEKEMGRLATEDELAKARKIPFSVDYIFCKDCEDVFTQIEDKFAADFLTQFRDADLSNINAISFGDVTSFRLFFLMQVWRTHICTEIFKISATASEKIRKLLLQSDEARLKEFPLTITYLETSGGQMNYTTNFIGFSSGTNPNIIFMNDFVIQFFEDPNDVRCIGLYGVNETSTFGSFLNHQEAKFVVKVIPNERRKKIMTVAVTDIRVKPLLAKLQGAFNSHWTNTYKSAPSSLLTQCYIKGLVDWDNLPRVQQLSEERVRKYTSDFFKKYGG